MSCHVYCPECNGENDPPTDVQLISGSYRCVHCQAIAIVPRLDNNFEVEHAVQRLYDRIERLEQKTQTPVENSQTVTGDDYTLVKTSTLKYLLGEVGEFRRPEGAGPYWWRSLLRASMKPVTYHWTDCKVKLPTEVDADCEGKVWYKMGNDITRLPYQVVVRLHRDRSEADKYWMKTGLENPTQPD